MWQRSLWHAGSRSVQNQVIFGISSTDTFLLMFTTRIGDPGVLILSPFAGAGEMMHEALRVNPYEIQVFTLTPFLFF